MRRMAGHDLPLARDALVGAVGLEPTSLAAADFKSAAYANSATAASARIIIPNDK